ncbi:MAG: PKD domain-containing protein [Bacteroidia bacterium]
MIKKILFILFIFTHYTFFAQEICNNGIDDDGDGFVDCYDSQCSGNADCNTFFYGKPAINCSATPTNPTFSLNTIWQSTVNVSTRSTMMVGDVDNDGVPEVVCHQNSANELYILDGITGAVEVTINCPAIADHVDAITIGDTDDDGFGEIYVVTSDNKLRCFEHDGTAKAGYTPPATGGTDESIPGIADFDGDGLPELYKDNRIYNSLTGALIVSGGAGSTGNNPGSNGSPAGMPVAADVLPDNYCATCSGLELICGNKVYAVDISGATITPITNSLGSLGDGFSSVADIDIDGQLDVVVVSSGKIYVWNPRTGQQYGNTFSIPNTSAGGRANIGDYDNDGLPEIGAGGNDRYVVVDIDTSTNTLSQKWIKTIVDGSQHTTGSVFDFDCDGKAQVVYRDENILYVWDGETGSVLASIPCGSATRSELPTIVDVDGDGQVNIVCACGSSNGASAGVVKAFNSSTNQWVGSRKVMNQHSYFVTNINDDLSIPTQLQNNSLIPQINGFSAQSPIYDVNWMLSCIPLANVNVSIDSAIYCLKPDSVILLLTMCNIGSKVTTSPLTIAVYDANPSTGGTLIANVQKNKLIYADSCLKDTITVPYNGNILTYHIYVNDDGSSPINAPQLLFMECDSTNNNDSILLSQSSTSIEIAGDTVICYNESTTIIASGANLYTWSPSTGLNTTTGTNIIATPLSTTTYTVTGINTSTGCSSTINFTITVNPKPIAVFGSTSVCGGLATQFTDTSTTSLGSITTWNYNFGDNNTLNILQNPTHVYDSGGTYIATLIVTNSFGCLDTTTKNISVFYKPSSSFTSSDVCFGDSTFFNNSSTIHSSSSISSNVWNFGDNNSSVNSVNTKHVYTNSGNFNVKLITTSIDGCKDSITNTVNVFDAPTSAFTYNNACFLDATSFTSQSLNPSLGTISNWKWDFGDGSPANTSDLNPNHIYTSVGSYYVSLITFSSNLGCSDTLIDTISVYPKPIANWGVNEVCLNTVSVFTDSSVITNGSITNWLWSFGDSSPTNNNQNPTHNYQAHGSFSTSLIVTSADGCKDTLIKSVLVHPLPTAQFETTNICADSTALFYNVSTIPTNNLNDVITNWSWNFGDGGIHSGNGNINVSHQYSTAGNFPVQLLVETNFGCQDSITATLTVHANPIAQFTVSDTNGCEELCIMFENTSTISSGTITSWAWDFGDGATNNNSQQTTHCYTNSAGINQTYTPSLIVTSENGCTNTIAKNNYITVYPLPVVQFSVSPQVAQYTNPIINITNESSIANSWSWSFGDGSSSTVENPNSHTYTDTGTYTITLVGTTQNNCLDTNTQTIIIEPDFLLFVPNAFTPNEDGVNDFFSANGIFVIEFEMQIFDRWGNLVFETNNLNTPWDGKVKNSSELAQQDVYVYSIKAKDFRNEQHKFKGIVTLIK